MKKLILILLFCPMMIFGQSVNFNASTIVGSDTILKCYTCGDRSSYNWMVRVVTGADDSLQVTFGGRMLGGNFVQFAVDSLPYYITPENSISIEDNDTIYETYFTGGFKQTEGMYGFKIPEVKIDSIDATGVQYIYYRFWKP